MALYKFRIIIIIMKVRQPKTDVLTADKTTILGVPTSNYKRNKVKPLKYGVLVAAACVTALAYNPAPLPRQIP